MIAIIDYKAGNLTSVKLAFEHLGIKAKITNLPEEILAADRVVFPGVGSAGAALRNIVAFQLGNTLKTVVDRGTPFLGICLGTQIIFDFSEEDGGTKGLSLLSGKVKRFAPLCLISYNQPRFEIFSTPVRVSAIYRPVFAFATGDDFRRKGRPRDGA